jgi:hypothetical protein
MKMNTTERQVMSAFLNVGEISRIDFTPIGKKPGFLESTTDNEYLKSAFVHFSTLSMWGLTIKSTLEFPDGSFTFYPDKLNPNQYWILLKARNPIQETMMNNSQIVENCRFLEEKLIDQSEKLSQQAEIIQSLKSELKGVQQVVYQLLGGLFCQSSQRGILEHHVDLLFSESERVKSRFDDSEPDNSKWTNWPTTRQGDEAERRIEALEAQVYALTNFDPAVFEDEEEEEAQDNALHERKYRSLRIPADEEFFEKDSVSTHSSMPGLISDDDSMSSHSSMPDLEEVKSVSSEGSHRIKMSFELCGNE